MMKQLGLGLVVMLSAIGTPRASGDVSDRRACEAGEARCVDNFVRLRDAPTADARAAVAADIEAFAGAVAAGIAQATAYPPGSDSAARDAFCAAHTHD